MQDKLLSFFGIIKKSGKLSIGYDVVIRDIEAGKAKLILLSSDASEKTVAHIEQKALQGNIKCLRVARTKEELMYMFGRLSAVLLINDDGFSKKVVKMIQEEAK